MTPPSLEAQRQKRYRDAKTARYHSMEDGLTRILSKLEGNTKPLANEIRDIATNALDRGTG